MIEEHDLNALALEEIAALAQRGPLKVEMPPLMAFFLIAQCQLAFRHPQNTGQARRDVARLMADLRRQICSPGDAIDTILAMGDDPRFDVNSSDTISDAEAKP